MQDGWKAVWIIPYISVAFFPGLKPNFIAYRSSKVSDCITECTTYMCGYVCVCACMSVCAFNIAQCWSIVWKKVYNKTEFNSYRFFLFSTLVGISRWKSSISAGGKTFKQLHPEIELKSPCPFPYDDNHYSTAASSMLAPRHDIYIYSDKKKLCMTIYICSPKLGDEHFGEGINGCHLRNAKLFKQIEHFCLRYRKM